MTDRPVPSSAGVSARMSRHPRRDTGPELALRHLLHAAGYRYRVNYPVPGLPRRSIDIAFTRAKVAVFIDGCFWHGCPDHGQVPTANNAWWIDKLDRNRERDTATTAHLEHLGWTVLRLWEHADVSRAFDEVTAVLGPRDGAGGATNRSQVRRTSSSSSS